MHLASDLVPNGPKSKGHYTILHKDNQSHLIELPESYRSLENAVKTLFHIETGRFYVETDSLNICCGKRIKIPSNFWAGVAQLLGNIYVVEVQDNPESAEAPIERPSTDQLQGRIRFGSPLQKNGYLVVSIRDVRLVGFDSSTPSVPLTFQVFDNKNNIALTVTLTYSPEPKTGTTRITFGSERDSITTSTTQPLSRRFNGISAHHIVIHQQAATRRFVLFFDGHFIASIAGPLDPLFTSLFYQIGTSSPFKGPLSATTFASVEDVARLPAESRPALIQMGKNAFYEQFLVCIPGDALQISTTLALGIAEPFRRPSIVPLYKDLVRIGPKYTLQRECDLTPRSMFLLRFTLHNLPSCDYIWLYFLQNDTSSLAIKMWANGQIKFTEDTNAYSMDSKFHQMTLTDSRTICSPGEHAIALINEGPNLRVIFDWKQSTVLPRDTILTKKPNAIIAFFGPNRNSFANHWIDIDFYQF